MTRDPVVGETRKIRCTAAQASTFQMRINPINSLTLYRSFAYKVQQQQRH